MEGIRAKNQPTDLLTWSSPVSSVHNLLGMSGWVDDRQRDGSLMEDTTSEDSYSDSLQNKLLPLFYYCPITNTLQEITVQYKSDTHTQTHSNIHAKKRKL